jgi:hypothetical protein
MGLRPTQEDEKHATKVCLALYQGTTLPLRVLASTFEVA